MKATPNLHYGLSQTSIPTFPKPHTLHPLDSDGEDFTRGRIFPPSVPTVQIPPTVCIVSLHITFLPHTSHAVSKYRYGKVRLEFIQVRGNEYSIADSPLTERVHTSKSIVRGKLLHPAPARLEQDGVRSKLTTRRISIDCKKASQGLIE